MYLFITHWELVSEISTVCKKGRKKQEMKKSADLGAKFYRLPASIFFFKKEKKPTLFNEKKTLFY